MSVLETEAPTASKISKWVHCSHNTNFKLMVIKHAEKINNCTLAWTYHVTEQNVWQKKITIIKGCKFKPKHSNTMSPVWGMAVIRNCPLTPAGNIRRPFKPLLDQCIETACSDISPKSIVKGFKKCCVPKNTKGRDDLVGGRSWRTLLLVMKASAVTS
jgi:hypothetical protein